MCFVQKSEVSDISLAHDTADCLGSCSLNCFNKHKSQCSEQTQQLEAKEQSQLSNEVVESQSVLANPGLTAADLAALFAKYPSLQPLLQQIYHMTKEGDTLPQSRPSAQFRKTEPQHERSLRALRDMLSRDGEDAAALSAFMELIAKQQDDQLVPDS